MKPLAWMDQAACKGAELALFFPPQPGPNQYAEARSYCETCPVILECDRYAIEHMPTYGMWGGRTRLERKQDIARSRLTQQFGEGHGDKAGTTTGYWREVRAGIDVCDECRNAMNANKRERDRKLRAKERGSYASAS